MADRPRDDTWWIASDGKWYPPTLHPDPTIPPVAEDDPATSTTGSTAVPALLSRVLTSSLVATSAAFALAAFFGFQHGSQLRSGETLVDGRSGTEDLFLGWSSIALFALVVTGAVVLAWTFRTSKAFDMRGATHRRWRGAWTIGAWFIPLASFILPKLVFNELEKIAQVPFTGDAIGDRWKEESRSAIGDLWWLLWVTGLFLLQATQVFLTDPEVDSGTMAVAASLSGVAHFVLAAAGVALVVVVRRIAAASRA